MEGYKRTVVIRISNEQNKFLEKVAKDMGTDNMSEVVRRIINSYQMLLTVLYGVLPTNERERIIEKIRESE